MWKQTWWCWRTALLQRTLMSLENQQRDSQCFQVFKGEEKLDNTLLSLHGEIKMRSNCFLFVSKHFFASLYLSHASTSIDRSTPYPDDKLVQDLTCKNQNTMNCFFTSLDHSLKCITCRYRRISENVRKNYVTLIKNVKMLIVLHFLSMFTNNFHSNSILSNETRSSVESIPSEKYSFLYQKNWSVHWILFHRFKKFSVLYIWYVMKIITETMLTNILNSSWNFQFIRKSNYHRLIESNRIDSK